ncbi:MAG: hypothetical protein Q4P07_12535 [Ornithinimicrobium sp.]|uniref:hypothetical protein n=1 Tax=Ornithinimicrobium sp. TaxID=1977084 RepID=UPI0026E0371E|nr:hypothetical protein [Ornithinimicrobium sp.]MDO5740961.1 hypothetical protein [Ornithinimicrobium sp.]
MGLNLFGQDPMPREDGRPARDEDYPGLAPEHSMGTSVLSYLLAGPILFGGIAWLIGRWTGLEWLSAVGILAGMGMSIYIIWVRYGTQ